jgi:hypothetical protein
MGSPEALKLNEILRNAPKVRFSATLGEEPEIELFLV